MSTGCCMEASLAISYIKKKERDTQLTEPPRCPKPYTASNNQRVKEEITREISKYLETNGKEKQRIKIQGM